MTHDPMQNIQTDTNTDIKRLLSVSRGDTPADLILKNARLINVFTRTVEQTSVAIVGERIAGVGEYLKAADTVDLNGAYLAPGLIDAHMHIESTMMMPGAFVKAAAPHGTTSVILDPHEIANVLGVAGIRMIMDACRHLSMNCFFTLPSCVPSSPLESSGALIEASDLEPLFKDSRVVALAEVMNYPGVIAGNPDLMAKIRLGLMRGRVDGHCPGISGLDLQAYIATGVSSEHECSTASEAIDRVRAGMHVFVREGSAARNLEAIVPIITHANAHRFSFCTDDRHPDDLVRIGHIDHCVRLAIQTGLDPILAIAMATIHTADHYGLREYGAIAPGRFADMIVFEDIKSFAIKDVYHHGGCIIQNGTSTNILQAEQPKSVPDGALNTVRLHNGFCNANLEIDAIPNGQIRVIDMNPQQIVTGQSQCTPSVQNGQCIADIERDLLKIAVVERHRLTGNIGLGFVRGFGLQQGAIASTVGHDAHNLITVGTNDNDMAIAVRALVDVGGGLCVVDHGKIKAILGLPIAGLISPLEADDLIQAQQRLLNAAAKLGCPIHDPFMPLSFLALPVIPSLKITDLGLVDVDQFQVVPLQI